MMRFFRSITGCLFAGAMVAATQAIPAHAVLQPKPDNDSFYVSPDDLGSLSPGAVIRKRVVTSNLLGIIGIALPMVGVKSYQILVRSTDSQGRPAAVAATVIVPTRGVAVGRNLLSYQPATDSLGPQCEPSHGLRVGHEKEAGLIQLGLAKGWTVVVPDHEGPRHAYAAGRMAGHATLDAIRGAESLPESQVSGSATPVGMIGYSGGAIATGWAAELQASYAPELNVVGVASGGTPADLEATGDQMDGGPFGGLFLGATLGLAREYPELLSVFNARGLGFAKSAERDCSTDLMAKHPYASIRDYSDLTDPLRSPVAQAVLADNRMGSAAPKAPVYLWHSRFDELVPHQVAVTLKRQWCEGGGSVKFVTDYISEHVLGAFSWLPGAYAYLAERFAGRSAPTSCS